MLDKHWSREGHAAARVIRRAYALLWRETDVYDNLTTDVEYGQQIVVNALQIVTAE